MITATETTETLASFTTISAQEMRQLELARRTSDSRYSHKGQLMHRSFLFQFSGAATVRVSYCYNDRGPVGARGAIARAEKPRDPRPNLFARFGMDEHRTGLALV